MVSVLLNPFYYFISYYRFVIWYYYCYIRYYKLLLMKLNYIGLLLLLAIFYSCGGSKAMIGTAAEKEQLQQLIATKEFEINATWAVPRVTNSFLQVANSGLLPGGSSASNINLIGNPNYLKFKKDSVFIALPYYGERQMGGGYNTNTIGINFEGNYEDYQENYIAAKQYYTIDFTVRNGTESLDFSIRLYDNLKTNMMVTSSHRTPIGFDGMVSEIETKEKE